MLIFEASWRNVFFAWFLDCLSQLSRLQSPQISVHQCVWMVQVTNIVGLSNLNVIMEDSPSMATGTSPNEQSLHVAEEVNSLVYSFWNMSFVCNNFCCKHLWLRMLFDDLIDTLIMLLPDMMCRLNLLFDLETRDCSFQRKWRSGEWPKCITSCNLYLLFCSNTSLLTYDMFL